METFTLSVVEFVRHPDSVATGFLLLAIASLFTSCVLIPRKNVDPSTLHQQPRQIRFAGRRYRLRNWLCNWLHAHGL
jgi:hypothetical protein